MAHNGKPDLKGYELLERIGSGGFGAVYRAKQTTVGREVAVKVIQPGLANKPDFIRRFEIEAQLVARLEHPFITPLIDYWRDPEGAYLVMRYLRGGSLRGSLNSGAYELETTSRILDQIASALDFAHRNNVIHRDIKPANILLDEDGNVYLADFGIAKDLGNLQGSVTNADSVVGSLDYISPEQARSEAVTPRTDIYSLGVMLYELITGQHPFHEASTIERLYKHINDPLPDIEGLSDDVRDQINDIIQQATAKDPANRYPDVLALAVAFREAIGRGDTTADLQIIEQLTLREHEILNFIADGMSNRQIADTLVVAVTTIKWHIRQIYKKLGVRNRVQAIVRARELDLIQTSDEDGDLIALQQKDAGLAISLPEPENPYKGLHAFQTGDERDFFGREKLTKKLMGRLAEDHAFQRFLAIVGPSGSGKSSLVKAGVVPALWRGGLPNSEKWFVVDMMPGTRPIDELEIALIRVAANQSGNLREQLQRDEFGLVRAADLILPKDDTELVVVVDQFEEVFTLVENEEQRQHFLNLIYAAATDKRSRVRIVVTLRADYYDKPLHYPRFGEMLRSRMETVMPLSAKELEMAIRNPAERVGVSFEGGLVAQIVGEMTYQAAALPLLQYALTELFDRREGRILTNGAYADIGGAVGALANRADEIYESMDDAGQELTRQMFLRLVTLGEGAEDTRRRTPMRELLSLTNDVDHMEEIIDTFADYRLLALDRDEETRQPTVEVAHEAILREWERLRQWLNDSRDDIKQERQLAQAAADWQTHNQDKSYLLRGSRLEQIEHWGNRTELALTPLENEFVERSIKQREIEAQQESERQARETAQEQRSRTLLRALVAVFALAAIISGGFGIFALSERNRAEDALQIVEIERDNAKNAALENQALALSANARVIFDEDAPLALALAVEANHVSPTILPYVENTLSELGFAPGFRGFRGVQDSSYKRFAIAVSPDETYIAQSKRVVVGDEPLSDYEPYLIDLWNVERTEVVRTLGADGQGHSARITGIVFSPDSQLLYSSSLDNSIIEWDANTGEINWRLDIPTEASLTQIAISRSGAMLAISGWSWFTEQRERYGGVVAVVDLETAQIIWTHETPQEVNGITFHPDESSIIVGMDMLNPESDAQGKSVIKIDVNTGEETFLFEPTNTVWILRSSLQGDTFLSERPAVGTSSYTVGLFDANSGEVVQSFEGHQMAVNAINFSPDGQRILTAGWDARLIEWDVKTGEALQEFNIASQPDFVAYINNGLQAITYANTDEKWRTFDLAHGAVTEPIVATDEYGVWSLDIHPDGQLALTGTGARVFGHDPDMNFLVLRSWPDGAEIRRFEGHTAKVKNAWFLPDSTQAVSVSANQIIRWDYTSGETLTRIDLEDIVIWWSALEPDGETIVAAIDSYEHEDGNRRGFVDRWNMMTGERIERIASSRDSYQNINLDLTSDGKTLVFDGANTEWSGIFFWDLEVGVELSYGHLGLEDDFSLGLDISPDDKLLATASAFTGKVVFWDMETREEIRRIDIGSQAFKPWFSPDSRYLFVSEFDTGDLNIIEVSTGKILHTMSVHTGMITDLRFISENKFVTASIDGSLYEWLMPPTTSQGIQEWILENRYIPEFSCADRELYRIEPLCEADI